MSERWDSFWGLTPPRYREYLERQARREENHRAYLQRQAQREANHLAPNSFQPRCGVIPLMSQTRNAFTAAGIF